MKASVDWWYRIFDWICGSTKTDCPGLETTYSVTEKQKHFLPRSATTFYRWDKKKVHTDKPLSLLEYKRNIGRILVRMRSSTSIDLHLKMLPKLHFKCNLNVIFLFNYTDVIVCRLNAATRNHWAMNIDLFLFGIIFNTFVLNRGQFSFSFEFLYQSDTV